jgi:hypothetical protein
MVVVVGVRMYLCKIPMPTIVYVHPPSQRLLAVPLHVAQLFVHPHLGEETQSAQTPPAAAN